MSNSSEPKPPIITDGLAPMGPLSRLLSVISDELTHLATEMVKLGELLSRDALEQKQAPPTYDLQSFDIVSQTAQAQARLLKRLAEGDAGPSGVGISALIEEVPFAQMRRRLHGASNGTPPEQDGKLPEEDDTQVSWF